MFLIGLLGFAIMWVAHLLLIDPAYFYSYVAYVGTLKRMSILITVILGFVLFKEQDFKKRLGAAICIMTGAILISMEDLPERLTSHIELWGL
ncbi:hypothetical protein FJY93_03415 [Candidatus Kaiserbacteria bacterium]|nr:hypothetical protein [Candidatus Kaiserbacteria bacterium]